MVFSEPPFWPLFRSSPDFEGAVLVKIKARDKRNDNEEKKREHAEQLYEEVEEVILIIEPVQINQTIDGCAIRVRLDYFQGWVLSWIFLQKWSGHFWNCWAKNTVIRNQLIANVKLPKLFFDNW